MWGLLCWSGQAKQRAACRAGPSPGGMWGCGSLSGSAPRFTIHYEQPQAAGDAHTDVGGGWEVVVGGARLSSPPKVGRMLHTQDRSKSLTKAVGFS